MAAGTDRHKITIVATGGRRDFTVEGAMKAARGFHRAAGDLETLHQQQLRPGHFDQAAFDQLVGRGGGAVVLEALAIELVLKARLKRAGISFD